MPKVTTKAAAAAMVLLALAAVPAPILPPHRLAYAVGEALPALNWRQAYFVTTFGLHLAFYGALGVLSTFAVGRAASVRMQLLQLAVVPCMLVAVALLIRSIKLGHVPVWTNAIVPIASCVAGVALGLFLRYRGPRSTAAVAMLLAGAALWAWAASPSSELSAATDRSLRRVVAASATMPAGEARFGGIVQAAFAPAADDPAYATPALYNRAAILGLGIALGDERLARFVGVRLDPELVERVMRMREGTALSGREDWARHYSLSAALTVLQHPFMSDAAGLMKEQLDALTQGTGFSFGDLAADRAGVRFATAATHSVAAAQAMQARLARGYTLADFFPHVADLPENLTVEQIQGEFGGVGSERYRRLVAEIEARLDRCPALTLQ